MRAHQTRALQPAHNQLCEVQVSWYYVSD